MNYHAYRGQILIVTSKLDSRNNFLWKMHDALFGEIQVSRFGIKTSLSPLLEEASNLQLIVFISSNQLDIPAYND